MYNVNLAEVDVEKLKAEILASINDLGEWKLVGSASYNNSKSISDIEFKELMLVFKGSNPVIYFSFNIPKALLTNSSQKFEVGASQCQASVSLSTVSNNANNTTLYVYYR